jgi:hypothetical protein
MPIRLARFEMPNRLVKVEATATDTYAQFVAEPFDLEMEMAEGESAAVIGPTRHPASRVESPFRCNRCEPESLVEPSTTPSSSLSIPVSRLKDLGRYRFDSAIVIRRGLRCQARQRLWCLELRVRPVLEMLVTFPGGGAASLAASAACLFEGLLDWEMVL